MDIESWDMDPKHQQLYYWTHLKRNWTHKILLIEPISLGEWNPAVGWQGETSGVSARQPGTKCFREVWSSHLP